MKFLISILSFLCVILSCMRSTAETRTLIYLTEWYRRGSCSSSFGTQSLLIYSAHTVQVLIVLPIHLLILMCACVFFYSKALLLSVCVRDVCNSTCTTVFLTKEKCIFEHSYRTICICFWFLIISRGRLFLLQMLWLKCDHVYTLVDLRLHF